MPRRGETGRGLSSRDGRRGVWCLQVYSLQPSVSALYKAYRSLIKAVEALSAVGLVPFGAEGGIEAVRRTDLPDQGLA